MIKEFLMVCRFGACLAMELARPLYHHPEEPKFAETNVTAQLGGSVFLHCPVLSTGDRGISWIRLRDWHILTNGMVKYTSDCRFQVLHKEGSYDWVLQIKIVQESDAGHYECQVSTSTGIISRKVQLKVVIPEAFILGADGLSFIVYPRGSQISLICMIEKAQLPPQYMFWYHNERMVNYDTERGLSVATSNGTQPSLGRGGGSVVEKSQSKFIIAQATLQDSGNYTCKPSNAMPASIQVYVSKSRVYKTEVLQKQSSSLQHSGNSNSEDGLSSSLSSAATASTKGYWLYVTNISAITSFLVIRMARILKMLSYQVQPPRANCYVPLTYQ